MAHTFGSTILARSSSTATTINRSATTVAGDTVLVLLLNTQLATTPTSAPTWNGVAGTRADVQRHSLAGFEASVEIWYWLNPFIGTANLAIPNGGAGNIFSAAYTGRAATGRGSVFDVATGGANVSVNPTTPALVTTAAGDIIFASTAGGWQAFAPTARTGTSLYETDDGAVGGGGQYLLQGTAGSQAMGWTFGTSDDWGAVAVAFKETLQPAPDPASLTLTGTLSVLALAVGLGVGSLGLTGYAPDLAVSSGSSPTIAVPAGALQFKGPARPTHTAASAPVTLALTGQAPTLTLTQGAITLSPSVGALTLAGAAPTAPPGQAVAIPAGELLFRGPARAGAVPIDVPLGTFALSGQVPTATVNPLGSTTITPAAGTLTLAGPVPLAVRNQQAIAIPVGALRFHGPAGPGGPFTIAVGAGALALTAPSPTRVVSGQTATIPIPVGAITFSGDAPGIFAGPLVEIPVGVLTLTGQYVAQAWDFGQPAALVLTGHAPSALSSSQRQIQIDVASLTLSGPAPTVLTAAGLPITPAQLTLLGRALLATVSDPNNPTLGLNEAVLSFAGPFPAIVLSESAGPPPGELVFTGYEPSLAIVDPSVLTRMVRIPRRQRVAVIRGREHTT